MRLIKKHNMHEQILTKLCGWKWLAFRGRPTKSHPNYHEGETTVRQFFSAKQIKNMQEEIASGEYWDADMTEPLSYRYCSSVGPAFIPAIHILIDDSND